MSFNDLFSGHAKTYSKFRPGYPDSLFKYLAGLCPIKDTVWDCGTGNGQAALALSSYFKKVIATDGSAAQLESAPRFANVEYRVAVAENSGLAPASIDLVTVAQALHWFDLAKFFPEVRRVLKPKGLLAVWCYGRSVINSELDAVVDDFYAVTLKGYWDPARRFIDEGYTTIPFPFEEHEPKAFELSAEWNLGEFLGYLDSWSAVQTYIKKKGKSPLPDLAEQMLPLWGKKEVKRAVRWPVSLRVGRL